MATFGAAAVWRSYAAALCKCARLTLIARDRFGNLLKNVHDACACRSEWQDELEDELTVGIYGELLVLRAPRTLEGVITVENVMLRH